MTAEKSWPKNQIQYRNEAAEWISKAITEQSNGEHGKAMFSMMTALRWLEKAGAPTLPMSIETIRLFADFGK